MPPIVHRCPPTTLAIACLALTLHAAAAIATELNPPADPTPSPSPPIDIPIDNPGPKYRLIGRLGKPLGETVKLQGIVIDGPSKGYEGGPNVIIKRLNGETTQQYLRLPIKPYFGDWGEDYRDHKAPPKLLMGTTFELEGYETGGYCGTPWDAYEKAGLEFQTGSHYFRSYLSIFAGTAIEPIRYAPSDFIDREALLEGSALNRDAAAVIIGEGWEVTLDGPLWPPTSNGKRAEAFGTVRKRADGSFRMESKPIGRRGLAKLEDQLNGEVSLRGTAWNMNSNRTFNYRGQTMTVDIASDPPGESWPHGEPVCITGDLEQLPQPQSDKPRRVYTIKHATWQRATSLLVPELDMNNPQ